MSPVRNPQSVQVFDEGSFVGNAGQMDFRGAGVATTFASGQVIVSIGGGAGTEGVSVLDEGVGQGRASAIDFRGAGVTATVTASVATVSIPTGVSVADEGAGAGQVSAFDFRGAGVAATVAAGVATVSIAGAGTFTTMKVPSDQAVSLAARTSVSAFGFAATSVTDYGFRYHIVFRTQASTTGYRFGMDGPAGSVFEYLVHYQTVANATVGADVTMRKDVASFAMAALTSTPVTSVDDLLCTIEGTIRVSATAGAIDVVCATEVAGSNLTIKKGSWGFRL